LAVTPNRQGKKLGEGRRRQKFFKLKILRKEVVEEGDFKEVSFPNG